MLEYFSEHIPFLVLLVYASVMSVISVIVCAYDKVISKKGKVELRVPEKTLMTLSFLGGSVAMFITMKVIRHKTKHKKFMIGIPFIILLQAAVIFALIYFGILSV